MVIQHIPESEIPQLTEAEETKVQGMVFSDVRVRELIGKRRYTIESIGVWINTKHQKIGGFVEISFDEPFFADYNWPVIDCDVEKYGEAYYREGTVHEALWVKKLNIRVDLQKGKVVDITPLPFG
ncbi:MAG: hypothetical protein DDT30_02085 [Dehalococcoidia bacterium]|nr:hypothetical protein [Bacillota bacterium]